MILERMLELSILNFLYDKLDQKEINVSKFNKRHSELLEEFIKPYVIDNAEKSE